MIGNELLIHISIVIAVFCIFKEKFNLKTLKFAAFENQFCIQHSALLSLSAAVYTLVDNTTLMKLKVSW